jgi:hypothetical protein
VVDTSNWWLGRKVLISPYHARCRPRAGQGKPGLRSIDARRSRLRERFSSSLRRTSAAFLAEQRDCIT